LNEPSKEKSTTIDRIASPTRAAVVLPLRPYARGAPNGTERSAESRLAEGIGLARAIDLEVAASAIVPLSAYRPATLIGSGKVAELAHEVEQKGLGLVVVDHPLTAVQQRNLEKAWKAKVIDRTGLILEIFGDRAHTREGVLQVELAHLTYQKGRLVRSWTHLERQRGGFGFLGGPGETQIEADRRMIQNRIKRIEQELKRVAGTRRLQRKNRRRTERPTIALVGYTNAGKSTLFNRLTESATRAEDRLFATLDPTLRRLPLPAGGEAILSDTVGFVSDLPTELVAAFRATLEEVVEADLILHVRDIAHPDTASQARDVEEVLRQLGVKTSEPDRIIEVWNKVDLLPAHLRPNGGSGGVSEAAHVTVSALTGEGVDGLLALIEEHFASGQGTYRVELSGTDTGRLHRLYELGEVLKREDREDGSIATITRVFPRSVNRFLQVFPQATSTKGE
jgi:GTP-binding protein HflX